LKALARFSFYLAALGSLAASLAHIWCILSGPSAYAFMGAPPEVVASAEAGTLYAPLITSFIAAVIFVWVLYALSAAGKLPRLFLLRTGLIAIASVLLLRGLVVLPIAMFGLGEIDAFGWWSSVICFALGALYAIGIVFGWKHLGKRT
jgi:hypothetical protein